MVGDGLGLGGALVVVGGALEELTGVGDLEAGAVVAVVADFVGDAEGLCDGLLLAEATGTWMMDVAPTE